MFASLIKRLLIERLFIKRLLIGRLSIEQNRSVSKAHRRKNSHWPKRRPAPNTHLAGQPEDRKTAPGRRRPVVPCSLRALFTL